MCATPCETCLRSFFLNVFFLPFFSGAGAPAAAAGFAIVFSSLVVGCWSSADWWKANDQGPTAGFYVFAAAFFLIATVPLRGPLRVRALVCVRCPRTGKFRRCRYPR